MLENTVDHNYFQNAPLSNEKLWQAINNVVVETEEGEQDSKRTSNNVNMINFSQSPVTTDTQRDIANLPN